MSQNENNNNRLRFRENMLVELDYLTLVSHSLNKTIDQLRDWGILKPELEFYCTDEECMGFERSMVWIQDQEMIDQGRYRCGTCNASKSLRQGSIFFNLKPSLVQLFRLAFICFIKKYSTKLASSELKIERHTVGKYYKFIREEISKYMEETYYQLPICSQPVQEQETLENGQINTYFTPACEVDESLFTHLSNIEGKWSSQCWVIGGIDRLNGDFRLKVIGNDRSEKTFKQFFSEYIATSPKFPNLKTRVYTDGHPSYKFLNSKGYSHHVINHSKGGFGLGINTTNHIESLWAQIKHLGSFNSGQKFSDIASIQQCLYEQAWRITCHRKDINLAHNLAFILKQAEF